MKQLHFKIVSIISLAIILAITFTACGEDSDEVVGFVWIPPGTFIMGSPDGTIPGIDAEPSRRGISDAEAAETQHQVTISKGFYMSKYQITQGQYFALMEYNPSNYKPSGDGKGRLPVEGVSWYDAIEFCNKLSEKYGLTPAYTINKDIIDANNTSPSPEDPKWTITVNPNANGYRLPTEAEWEYACRGDYPNKATEYATKPFGVGDGTKMTFELANFDSRTSYDLNEIPPGTYSDPLGKLPASTTEVGSYGANNYGLYDMHGNVQEWCWDWYGYYTNSHDTTWYGIAGSDPAGSSSGTYRMHRGGSRGNLGNLLRSAYRGRNPPFYQSLGATGFRVVRP